MSTSLDTTVGALFVGMVVAAVLYGISCAQALYYYTHQNDPWHIKLMVTVVVVFDTIHQALISHTVYTYAITDWGDPAALGRIVWSLLVEIIFTAITAFIVQSFLVMRIWRLSHRNIYITGISLVSATGGLITLTITLVVTLTQFTYLEEFGKIKGLFISVSALQAAADLLIAAALCTLLNSSRTGFYKSEIIINRLIFFTVNTGLLTSICALASLISFLAAGKTFLNMAFFFFLGRLYTNTLLATLNARNRIRHVTTVTGASVDLPISLQDLPTSRSTQQNISINVKTTSQKHHDQKLGEEKSGGSYV